LYLREIVAHPVLWSENVIGIFLGIGGVDLKDEHEDVSHSENAMFEDDMRIMAIQDEVTFHNLFVNFV
jgi:hypothetical protein